MEPAPPAAVPASAAAPPGTEPHPGAAAYRQARFRRPPGATELLLIRHGESQAAYPDKPFPLVDGHADPELAEEGREQAERLAERLGRTRIDAIYVTTLRRTAQTAAPLAARLGLAPRSSRTCARSTWASGRPGCSARWSRTTTRSPSGCGRRNAGTSSRAPSRPRRSPAGWAGRCAGSRLTARTSGSPWSSTAG